MQLNDTVVITMLQTNFMNDYKDNESDAKIFMSTLLFPLTFAFRNTSKIVDFKACLYASIHLNHYYTAFNNKLGEYDFNVC